MVYQGKPSSGCANCRKRKIKCDEGRPACSQCINTKRTCPGYVARFDLILRDQTKAVKRKAQRKKQTASLDQPNRIAYLPPRISSPPSSISSEETTPSYYGTAGLGISPTYAMIKRSNSNIKITPRFISDFPEQQAICAFFLDFVLTPRHPESTRGHLEHLLPLYQSASPNSPLALATSSVALAMSGSRHRNHQLARQTFGRALRKTSIAIRDPVESLRDSTLMAVLLLGLFERITASSPPSKSTPTSHSSILHTAQSPQTPISMISTHNAGAAALVKHRGPANCTSPLAIGLLFAVRTQLVESAIEEGQAFQRCPDQLAAIFKTLPQNAAARLTSVTINIADLRCRAKSALFLPRSASAEQEVTDLLEYAITIDLLVAAWPESLPENWMWEPATHFAISTTTIATAVAEDIPSAISSSAASVSYQGSKDVYLDLWVMSIWNQYRAARIRIQSIILACITWLGPGPHEDQWYWRGVYAKMIAQQMSDEICASVPFALGTRGGHGTRGQQIEETSTLAATAAYPEMAGRPTSEEHKRAAYAIGGWHLLDPLRVIVMVKRESWCGDVVREGQVEWCAQQMERIGQLYGLQGQKDAEEEGRGDAAAAAGVVGHENEKQQQLRNAHELTGQGASYTTEGGRVSGYPEPVSTRVGNVYRLGEQASGGVWERKSFEFPL